MIRYLNLPKIPNYLTDDLSRDPKDYSSAHYRRVFPDGREFVRSSEHCAELNTWCKENICDDIEWGIQIYTGEYIPKHIDPGHSVKLSYILELGGDNVVTEFFDNNLNLVYSRVIEPNRWFLIKTDILHQVSNVQTPRFTVTGTIMPYEKPHIIPKN